MKILDIIIPLNEGPKDWPGQAVDTIRRGVGRLGGKAWAERQARKEAEEAVRVAERAIERQFNKGAQQAITKWADMYADYIHMCNTTGNKILPFKQAVQRGLIKVEGIEKDQILKSDWLNPSKNPEFVQALEDLASAKAQVKMHTPADAAGAAEKEAGTATPKAADKALLDEVKRTNELLKKKTSLFDVAVDRGKVLNTAYKGIVGVEVINIWLRYVKDKNTINEIAKSGKIDPADESAFPSTVDPNDPNKPHPDMIAAGGAWKTDVASKVGYTEKFGGELKPYVYNNEAGRVFSWQDYTLTKSFDTMLLQLSMLSGSLFIGKIAVGNVGASGLAAKLVNYIVTISKDAKLTRILQAMDVAAITSFAYQMSTDKASNAVKSLYIEHVAGPLIEQTTSSVINSLMVYKAAIALITEIASSITDVAGLGAGKNEPKVTAPASTPAPAASSNDERDQTSPVPAAAPAAEPAEQEPPQSVDYSKNPPPIPKNAAPGARWVDAGTAWELDKEPWSRVPKR